MGIKYEETLYLSMRNHIETITPMFSTNARYFNSASDAPASNDGVCIDIKFTNNYYWQIYFVNNLVGNRCIFIRGMYQGTLSSWYKINLADAQWELLSLWMNNTTVIDDIESKFVATTEWTEFKYMTSVGAELYLTVFRRKLTGINSGVAIIGPHICHVKRTGEGIWYAKSISRYDV